MVGDWWERKDSVSDDAATRVETRRARRQTGRARRATEAYKRCEMM